MKPVSTQYLKNEKGKKVMVVLSVDEYERMIEELEELEDIRLYDEVKARNEKRIPFETYLKNRKKKQHA